MIGRAIIAIAIVMCITLGVSYAEEVPPPAPINTYPIHQDGGLIYNPLYREASATGQLAKYLKSPKIQKTVKLHGYTLSYTIPKEAVGYDVIPIQYNLRWDGEAKFPLAVEATAFEDEKRRGGKDLFDLALPGKLDLKVEYLGSITAHLIPNAKHNLKPDMTDEPGLYPGFKRNPMVKSGVVESGDIIWFKFKVTNAGNTILDPEGFGGWAMYPELLKKDASGEFKHYSNHYNLYIRDKKYLYPGESHTFWINFTSAASMDSYRIEPGEYRIDFRSFYRYYRDWSDWTNMWEGAWMYISQMPVTIKDKAENAPVQPMKVTMTDGGLDDKITRYIHTFEEFMTSFDCWQGVPTGTNSVSGTLYLQVAPWTKNVVVKLIGTDPVRCRTDSTKIAIHNASIKLNPKLHPGNCMVENGRRVPAVYSQIMSDMRANIQVSPWPEIYISNDLRRMKECGINICATTAMPWLYTDFYSPSFNNTGDAMKYALDVARKIGMKLEAWGSYPYDRSTVASIYKLLTGDDTPLDVFAFYVSQSDPNIAKANAAIWMYQFRRWGDGYAQFENGTIPFSTEDTRGWMRQDVNIRYPIGELSKKAFRAWLQAKYGDISNLNAAWDSSFQSFDVIDPEADGAVNMFGHIYEYLDKTKLFHDWSKPMADFDEWRTLLRIKNYQDSMDIIHRDVPQARMLVRTEGANAFISGVNPSDPNPHFRHIFYSQRRVAAIGDIIAKSKILAYHSDYTTIPYTPSEIRRITAQGVKDGIIPAWLPQFDNMRDIALNDKYGTDYQIHYNVDKPIKGAMMHVLTPVFPWFRAVIEEGGIPGILWEDLQCDGFATETQERELLFYKKRMQEYLASPDGIRASTKDVQTPDRSWLQKTQPKQSYKNAH